MGLGLFARVALSAGACIAMLQGCDTNVSYLHAAHGAAGHGGGPTIDASVGGALLDASFSGASPADADTGGFDATSGAAGSNDAGDSGPPVAGSGGATTTPRSEIVSLEGGIIPGSNDYGIDGVWHKFGADPDLIIADFSGNHLCIKGTVKGASNGNFDRYWGGGLQLVLRSGGAAYDATANGMGGIGITVSGNRLPATLRLKFKDVNSNDNYCKDVTPDPVTPENDFTLLVSEAVHNCWLKGGFPIPPSELQNFEIHMAPSDANDINFDFCVTKVRVVPAIN